MSWNKVGRVSSKNGSRRDHAATGVRIATYFARCVLRAVCKRFLRGERWWITSARTAVNEAERLNEAERHVKFPIIPGIRIDVFL